MEIRGRGGGEEGDSVVIDLGVLAELKGVQARVLGKGFTLQK